MKYDVAVSCNVEDLKPGMNFYDDVRTDGVLVASKDFALTSDNIFSVKSRLGNFGVSKVNIVSQISALGAILEDVESLLINDERYKQIIKTDDIRRHILDVTKNMYDNKPYVFDRGLEFKITEDHTYDHILDVSLFSISIGRYMGLSVDESAYLGLCGFSHDIGKLNPDIKKIISIKGKITKEDMEKVKEHPRIGYEILLGKPEDILLARVAAEHHFDQCKGGYGILQSDNSVLKTSSLIRLVDVFCALTTVRPQGRLFSTDDAIRKINSIQASNPFDLLYLRELSQILKNPLRKINLNTHYDLKKELNDYMNL